MALMNRRSSRPGRAGSGGFSGNPVQWQGGLWEFGGRFGNCVESGGDGDDVGCRGGDGVLGDVGDEIDVEFVFECGHEAFGGDEDLFGGLLDDGDVAGGPGSDVRHGVGVGIKPDGLGEQVGDRFGFDFFDGSRQPGAMFVSEFDVAPLVQQRLDGLWRLQIVRDPNGAFGPVGQPVPFLER